MTTTTASQRINHRFATSLVLTDCVETLMDPASDPVLVQST